MNSPIHFPENVEAASCRFPNLGKEMPANDTNRRPLHSCDSQAQSFVPYLFRALLLLAGTTAAMGGDNPVPASLPNERYVEMSAHSPFALATVAPPVQKGGPSFAANWYVSGIGRVNGEDYVTIKARDLSTQFSIHGQEEKDGVVLAGIEWSDVVGKSSVILRKGNETARVEFNEAELKGTPQAPGGAKQAPATTPPRSNPAVGVPPKIVPAGANPATTPNQFKPAEVRRRQVPIPAPR